MWWLWVRIRLIIINARISIKDNISYFNNVCSWLLTYVTDQTDSYVISYSNYSNIWFWNLAHETRCKSRKGLFAFECAEIVWCEQWALNKTETLHSLHLRVKKITQNWNCKNYSFFQLFNYANVLLCEWRHANFNLNAVLSVGYFFVRSNRSYKFIHKTTTITEFLDFSFVLFVKWNQFNFSIFVVDENLFSEHLISPQTNFSD